MLLLWDSIIMGFIGTGGERGSGGVEPGAEAGEGLGGIRGIPSS